MNNDNLYISLDIANRIKAQAKSKGISINELLSNCQLGINTVSKIAAGKDIHSKNLAKIADYLNCSIDYLMGRTVIVEVSKPINRQFSNEDSNGIVKMTILPFYRTPSSAGSGSVLFDDVPVEYVNVPKTEETTIADFLVEVRGDSMEPKYHDGDRVLVQSVETVYDNEIGVFILDGDSFIKKMGKGRLISLNPTYPPIDLRGYDSIRCAGKVIGILNLQ